MKRGLVIIGMLLSMLLSLNAQDNTTDSLKTALKQAKHDTTRVKLLSQLSEVCEVEDILKYAEPCVQLAEKNIKTAPATALKHFYLKHLGDAYNNIGFLAQQQGDIPKAINNYNKSLKIKEEIKDKQGIAYSLNGLGFIYKDQGDIPKALDHYQRSLKIQEEIKDKQGMSYSLNNIGAIYDKQGDVSKALEYYQSSLKLQEEIEDKHGMSYSLVNIGAIYNNLGDIPKALDYYHRALKMQEDSKDKQGMATSLNNIGIVYDNQGDVAKALEYYERSLKIKKEIKNKTGIANSLNNIGFIYKSKGDNSKALEYYHQSLKIREETEDKPGISESLNNIGTIYNDMGDVKEAIDYYKRALKLREELKDKKGMANSFNNIAYAMLDLGKLNEAQNYSEHSLQLAKELGYPENIKQAASTLKTIYQKQNKSKEALSMYELYIQMRDSVNNEKTKKASVKKQFQYQYEKKAAADSVKNAEEQKVKNALLTAQQAQIKQEKTKSYALYGGLALVLIFAGFMVNRFRVTNKQKQIIELKEIETQKQNEIITHQKHLVEEKHKEITDSINYAERIQRSFLATTELLDNNLNRVTSSADEGGVSRSDTEKGSRYVPQKNSGTTRTDNNNYFVFFQPKDVVSGDFYWAATVSNGQSAVSSSLPTANRNLFYLATADSTGHGVPGAIMSILNISCLENAVEQEKLTEPAEILNHTRTKIIERLKKDGSKEGGKDGMDCSLICFDFANSKLTYAAANNPVWIVRSNSPFEGGVRQLADRDVELIELPSDKMPVGKHDKDNIPFTQHTIELQKGDMVYTLTDGFPDQFGGLKGKKFMYKQLKELLISMVHLPMNEQKEILETTLNNWKGNHEQVDDICVIGIRI